MRKQALEHLIAVTVLRNVHNIGYGRKKRKDAKGVILPMERVAHNVVTTIMYRSRNQQKADL